jgi:hypothetical protein
MHELERRRVATERTVAKYRARPFDWDGATCIHLARTQLRNMGHRPPRIPRFYSIIGARRSLKQAGASSIVELIDNLGLERIPPAMMLIGDLAVLPGDEGFDSVVVCAGGALIGWTEDHHDGVMNLHDALPNVVAAWRL